MCLITIYAVFLGIASSVLDVDVIRRNTLKQDIPTLPRLRIAVNATSSFPIPTSTTSIVRVLCLLIITCLVPGIVCASYLRKHKRMRTIHASSNNEYKHDPETVNPVFCDYKGNDSSSDIYESVCKPWYLDFNNFYNFDTNIQHVRPASFEKYFSEVLSLKNSPTHEIMKCEWARYETFKDFPVSSPAIPMRLSQAGFYYTGTEDETACFSCGLKHRRWKSGESPLVVHKSKSPGCQFINGNDTTNVPIDNTKNLDNRDVNSAVSGTSPISFVGVAEGGQSDIQQNITSSSSVSVPNTNSPRKFVSPTIAHERGRNSGTSDRFSVHEYNGNQHETRENHRSNSQYQDNTSNTEDLGINFGRPKRPEFAILAVRLSTFKGWPRSVQQQPRDLADAGFYYAGHFQFTAQELMEIILDTEENGNTGDVLVALVEESEREQPEGRQAALSNVISVTDKDTDKLAYWGKEPDSKNENMSSDARASLLDENSQLKEQMTCKICLDGEACGVFLPCSHMVACPQCAPVLRKCPICRKLVRGTVRAFLS